MKYVCSCEYVYSPEIGDPHYGIEPGTPWENVSKEWTCPLCGLHKESFEKEK